MNYAVKLAKEVNCSIPDDVGKDHEQIVDCLRETSLTDLLEADVTPPAYLSAFGPSVDGTYVFIINIVLILIFSKLLKLKLLRLKR